MIPIKFVQKNNHKNVIVFIHGFTGGIDTWSNGNTCFPEMLLEDEKISRNFDLMYVNYHSKIFDYHSKRLTGNFFAKIVGKGSKAVAKNISIQELGDSLKTIIEFYCAPYQNVILVAHSMGGLISKSFLLSQTNESRKVKLFLSLAVPHNGSDWATFADALFIDNTQVVDLKPLSKTLNGINQKWINAQDSLPITVYFYGQYDMIVPEQSAVAYVGRTHPQKVACNDDHFSITTPESNESLVYVAVKKYLLDFLNSQLTHTEVLLKQFKDEGQLDNEIFVLKLIVADVHNSFVNNAKSTFFNAEYVRKFLVHQSISLDELSALYQKIEHLYLNSFGKLLTNKLSDSNELIADIHNSILQEDKKFLDFTLPLVDAFHKTGMLHQLANDLEKDIWWAKNHSVQDLNDLRKVRSNHE
jgi:hypothetical protein